MVALTGYQLRRAENNHRERQFRLVAHQFLAAAVRYCDLHAGGLSAAYADRQHALGVRAEGLCHTGRTCSNEHAAGNGSAGVIVQRGGVAAVGAADDRIPAGDLQIAVGIHSIAGCLHIEVAAVDHDASVRRTAHTAVASHAAEHLIPAAGAAGVRTARRVDAVIAGHQRNISAGDQDILRFQALIALRNVDGSRCDGQIRFP